MEEPGQKGNKITDKKLVALYYRALENIRKNAPDFYERYMEALARGRVRVDAFTNIIWRATEKRTGRQATAYQGADFAGAAGQMGANTCDSS